RAISLPGTSSAHFPGATCHQPSLIQRVPLKRPTATLMPSVLPWLQTCSAAPAGPVAARRTARAAANLMRTVLAFARPGGDPVSRNPARTVNALALAKGETQESPRHDGFSLRTVRRRVRTHPVPVRPRLECTAGGV